MSRHTWSHQGGLYSDRYNSKSSPSRNGKGDGSRLPRGRSRSPIREKNRSPCSSTERWRRRSPEKRDKRRYRDRERSHRHDSPSPSSSSSRRSSRHKRLPSPSDYENDTTAYEQKEEEEEEEEEEVPRVRVEFNCEVCDVRATNFDALQKHFAGAKHQKNLRKVGYGRNFKAVHEVQSPELSGKIIRCILCCVVLSGAELGVHVRCDSHLKALEKVEDRFKEMDPDKWFEEVTPKSEMSNKSGYKCTLCQVNLPTFEGYQIHVKGKRHQKAVKLAMNDESVLPGENVQPFWCQICNIYCTNQESLDIHLRGKKHMKVLKNKGINEEEVKMEGQDDPTGSSSTQAPLPNPFVDDVIMSKPPKVRCTLCDVTLSSNAEIHAHLSTTQHYLSLRKAPGKQLKDMLVPADS